MRRRIFTFICICILLCVCYALPASATAANDSVSDVVGDIIDDTVSSFEEMDMDTLLDVESPEDISAFLLEFPEGALVVLALLGLLLSFFGYRLFKLAIMILGFAGGWTLGSILYEFVIVKYFIEDADSLPEIVPVLVNFACAAILALLAVKLWALGVFLSSAVASDCSNRV